MSQNDCAIADADFPTMLATLQDFAKAVSTRQAGSGAPTLTSGAGPNREFVHTSHKLVYVRDNADAVDYILDCWAKDRVRAVTGVSDTVLAEDCQCAVTYSNTSGVGVTLPQATGTFGAGWQTMLANIGASGNVTIVPTTSTINGSGSLVLLPGQSARILSLSGNFIAIIFGSGNATTTYVDSAIASLAGVPTGVVQAYAGLTAPSSWLLLDGKTIGDGSSGATARANADTATLFALLWNNFGNSQCPVSTGRGASAAADFAAHKTITLPDASGRTIFGKDDMSGSAKGRLTNSASGGIVGSTMGASGGEQAHTNTGPESGLQAHTHTGSVVGAAPQNTGAGTPFEYAVTTPGAWNSLAAPTLSIDTAGPVAASSAHNTVPPGLVLTWIIKL